MKHTTIDTLFFDLDGTLTDNYEGIAGCIVHALARLDKAAPATAELQACIGPPLRHNFARLLETDDSAMIERALALYRERFDVDGWRENVPYPGIHDGLRTLADRRLPHVRLHVETASLCGADRRALRARAVFRRGLRA